MNMCSRLFLAGLLGLVTLRGAAQEPQGNESAPVFRSESRLVVVDAVITDKKGQPVPDLAVKDFHLWEDGKEQSIKSASRQPADRPDSRSYIVMLFVPVAGSEANYLRSKMQEFVASASPNRLLAVASYSGVGGEIRLLQSFTSDAEKLTRKAAAALRAGATAFEPQAAIMGEYSAGLTDPSYRIAQSGNAESSSYSGLGLARGVASIARNLGPLPGRKAVVLIAPGFLTRLQEHELAPVINACNKANVAVYTLDVRHDSAYDNTFEPLTEGTGGFAAKNPNDVLGALYRIAREQEERWVVTYSPTQSKEDSCHAIKLTVDRPGIQVRSRSAYCNSRPNDPLAETAVGRELEARAAAASPGNIPASMQAAYFYTEPGSARVHLSADLSTESLNFEKGKSGFHAAVNVLGIAATPEGETATRFTDTIEFNFENKDQLEQFRHTLYHYEKQFDTAPGRYNLKLVFSSGHDSFARIESPLAIDPADGTHLALGSLALCRETRSAAEAEGSIALLSDKVPLVSQGTEFVPAGSMRLQRTDTAGLYFELYEPTLPKDSPAIVRFRIRVIEKKSGAIVLDSQPMGIDAAKWKNPVIPVGWKFSMDKLARGSYVVDVVAMDSGAKPVARAINMEVE